MAGGGKGGSESVNVEIPGWAEDAARNNLARADDISRIGYTPYFGPDVAALSPMETSAFNNTNAMAQQFGMAGGGLGFPQAQNFGGGVSGYSSGGLYAQALQELADRRPGQYQAISDLFINPFAERAAQGNPAPGTPGGGMPSLMAPPPPETLNPSSSAATPLWFASQSGPQWKEYAIRNGYVGP